MLFKSGRKKKSWCIFHSPGAKSRMRLLPTALFISVMENQGGTVNASLYSEDMVTIKGIYHVLFTNFRFWLLSYS